MADVFDSAVDPTVRHRLWRLIRATRNLDWLLLTKRIGKFAPLLQWVINGGESGAGSRPSHLEWTRALIAERKNAAIPIFIQRVGGRPYEKDRPLRLNDRAGADWSEWPADFRIWQFPRAVIPHQGMRQESCRWHRPSPSRPAAAVRHPEANN
jgi:protein gp37